MTRYEFTQFVPAALNEVWDFFSSPANLSKITPSEMGFTITSPHQSQMYPGMFITYKVSPVAGLNLNWVTEITQVSEMKYFIDEQRRGPYSIWHHEHHFKVIEGGVEMRDILYYCVPFGFIGRLADRFFVRNRVEQIFSYRNQKINELFPSVKTEDNQA